VLEQQKMKSQAVEIIKLLEKNAINEGNTAYWKTTAENSGWSGNSNEVTSLALMAFLKVDSKNPVCSRAVKYLLQRRTNDSWYSTRDTAIAIIALTEYIKTYEEQESDFVGKLIVNDKEAGRLSFSPANSSDIAIKHISIPPEFLKNGNNHIKIKKSGKGRIYYSACFKCYNSDELIEAENRGFNVKREYFLINPKAKENSKRRYIPLKKSSIHLKPQDQVLVRLTVSTKVSRYYVIIEDPKPAGCEAMDSFSKSMWRSSSIEFRDEKVAFFVEALPEGKSFFEYRLRAETPGVFHTMPTQARLMYVPGAEGSSRETVFTIEDEKNKTAR
jgi:hypothetical protein